MQGYPNKTTIGVHISEVPSDVCSELITYRGPRITTPNFLPALAVDFHSNKVHTMLFL